MKTTMSVKEAAKELGLSQHELRESMKAGRLHIGVALKREGCKKYSFLIWRERVEMLSERIRRVASPDSETLEEFWEEFFGKHGTSEISDVKGRRDM